MNKKHFIMWADAIRNHNNSTRKQDIQEFTSDQIHRLACFCASQNRNFNRERWLGYIAGTCGPSGGKMKTD